MKFSVGSKVSVKGSLGIVRYIGKTEFQPGEWIGVELDDPVGKNDGSVLGIRYFECTKGSKNGLYGVFAKPDIVELFNADTTSIVDNTKDRKLELIIQKLEDKIKKLQTNSKSLNDNVQVLQAKNSELLESSAKLEESFELATVDKELLMAEKEQLNIKYIELEKSYKTLIKAYENLQEELKLSQEIDEELQDSDSDGYKLMAKKNKSLETALIKLQENSEFLELSRTKEITNLQKELEKLKVQNINMEGMISEVEFLKKQNKDLGEQLSSVNESVNIIENLTEQNMEASAKILQLEKTIDDLEELRKLDQEMEKNFSAIQSDLERRLEMAQTIIQEKESEIEKVRETNRDLEEMIIKNHKSENLPYKTSVSGGTAEVMVKGNPIDIEERKMSSSMQNIDFDLQIKRLLNNANEQLITTIYSLFEQFPNLNNSSSGIMAIVSIKRVLILLENICHYLTGKSYKELNTVSAKSYDGIIFKVTSIRDLKEKLRELEYMYSIIQFSETKVEKLTQISEQCQSFSGSSESMLRDESFNLELITFELGDHKTPQTFNKFFAYLGDRYKQFDMVDLSLFYNELILRGLALLFPSGRLNSSKRLFSLKAMLEGIKIILKSHIEDVVEAEKENRFDFDFANPINSKAIVETYNLTKNLSSDIGLALADFQDFKYSSSEDELLGSFNSGMFESSFEGGIPLFDCLEAFYKTLESLNVIFRFPNCEARPFKWFCDDPTTEMTTSKSEKSSELKIDETSANDAHEQLLELKLKINVLDSKLKKSEADELKILEYKEELDSAKSHKEAMLQKISLLERELEEKQQVIERNKRKRIVGSGDFVDIFEQKQFIEKATLISEMSILRSALKKHKHKVDRMNFINDRDLAWLKEESVVHSKTDFKQDSDLDTKLALTAKSLFKLNTDYSLISVDPNSPHTKAASYYSASLADDLMTYKKYKKSLFQRK